MQCAPSVGLLVKVIKACVVPTASSAREVWAFSSFLSGSASQQALPPIFLALLCVLLEVLVVFHEFAPWPRMATFYISRFTNGSCISGCPSGFLILSFPGGCS